MTYNIKELRENLKEKLIQWGLGQAFFETPAFVSIIDEFKELLSQINADDIVVNEQTNLITMVSQAQEFYQIMITIHSNRVSFILTKEKDAYFSEELERVVRNKTIVEKIAFIDENNNLVIVENGAELYNNRVNEQQCTNKPWFEKKVYNQNGIMTIKEYRDYPSIVLRESFTSLEFDTALSIPRNVMQVFAQLDPYNYRELLVRDKVDTAFRTCEDKSKGTETEELVQLSHQYSLRNMVIENNNVQSSFQEIEQLIEKEQDSRVKSGLKEYALNYNQNLKVVNIPVLEYRIKELKENLEGKMIQLGIHPSLKENAAFEEFLNEIRVFIEQMRLDSAVEYAKAKEQNGYIVFQWNSPYGEQYMFSIRRVNSNQFCSIMTEEKDDEELGKLVKCKNIIERVVSLMNNGEVILKENVAKVYDTEPTIKSCQARVSSNQKIYTSDGIVREKENRSYPLMKINEAFDMVKNGTVLSIPRNAFRDKSISEQYENRLFIVRDKLDTARIQVEDRIQFVTYNSVVPLSRSEGLQDMIVPLKYQLFPEEVLIPKLSIQEMEQIIQIESDPKIQTGLRKYATGRNENSVYGEGEYYYSSFKDPNFVCRKSKESSK